MGEEEEEGWDDAPSSTVASCPLSLPPVSTQCPPPLIPTRHPSPCFAVTIVVQLLDHGARSFCELLADVDNFDVNKLAVSPGASA